MKNLLLFLIILLSMCKNKPAIEPGFEGEFSGTEKGYRINAAIRITEERLKGYLTINGKKSSLEGKVNGQSAEGEIYDDEEDKSYDFTADISGDELRLTIADRHSRERNVLVLERNENKNSGHRKSRDSDEEERDSRLIGEWLGTEILGGGDASMTNETIIAFKEDGSFLTWPGRSSGPGYYRDEEPSRVSRGKWRTAGRKIYFTDPDTREEAATEYTVSENALLLSDGGSNKKTFQRRN